MVDFVKIATRPGKRKGTVEIYPKFIIKKSSDLMIRGGDFYAVWIEDLGVWSTDEQDLIDLIDRELAKYAKENRDKIDAPISVQYMWDAETGMINHWHTYCQKQMRDSFHPVDRDLIFSNHTPNKADYATKSLPYPLEAGNHDSFDKLMSTLYSDEERHKIEWGIGSVVTGDSRDLQKFFVLYGEPGTGKSTVFNIMEKLFEGYWNSFDARALGSASNSFAMEPFRNNPRVAINHDADLSRIEDNTRLNSIVSHETMPINTKFRSQYDIKLDTMLFIGTNKPVKITDGKSGLIRRLIDVSPTGNKLPMREYKKIVKQINFELGAIAAHCRDVFLADPDFYNDYVPINMLGASNDFYNFVLDSYFVFKKENGTSLTAAWEMYKTYCDDAKVSYPFSKRIFKEELKNYFEDFNERFNMEDGSRVRSWYSGFRTDKFDEFRQPEKAPVEEQVHHLIQFNQTKSILDEQCADCYAQYANSDGTPTTKWEKVKTTLKELDTSKLHYLKVPENHIVIDFDIADKDGNKNFKQNLEEASKWPATYAELSKSGAGIHLHYIYSGDVTKLSRVYDDKIEIKVFTGKSSLRRKLTKCNDLPIATISSGLPLKGDTKMIDSYVIKSEKGLRTAIKRNLNKEVHPATKPSIDFIHKILEDAYNSDLKYDVTDMRNAVLAFAVGSTNNSDYCVRLVNKMKFKSAEQAAPVVDNSTSIVFFDTEVFSNVFMINWKLAGEGKPIIRMINPTPSDIESLIQYRLVGFNCRDYDNHMIYACLMGYNNLQLYNLSKRLINKDKKVSRLAKFGEAFNISYADILDICNGDNKMSLKKWEYKLKIRHKELGLDWDTPVPQELWQKVSEYCDNDVLATEAVWNSKYFKPDLVGREILAAMAGGCINDTTNDLTGKIIFGNNRNPQDQFKYRNMGEMPSTRQYYTYMEEPGEGVVQINPSLDTVDSVDRDTAPEVFEVFDDQGRCYFPGYKHEFGVSEYRGEDPKQGGYVYANQGIWTRVAVLDVASMHPHSVIAEELFGPVYTAKFKELVDARVAIKHENWDAANNMLGGLLVPFVQRVINGEITSKDLAFALKIAINSVYGLTSASFPNRFRDPRNVDNIVAKRGALFMINLKHAVMDRGYNVVHIKTDSIKIAEADEYIIDFVMKYGEMYGYTFEHENTYDRMCLVNDAVYIARCSNDAINGKDAGKWTATGAQFAVPYVFKTLFSRENIEFDDLCELKSVQVGTIHIDMNEHLPNVEALEKELEDRRKGRKRLNPDLAGYSDEMLLDEIAKGHAYVFVGKVGQFCPVIEGAGGGELYRINEGSAYAVTGTKGYRWMETEMVQELGKEEYIDKKYYNDLVDAAIASISQYGDFEWFVSDDIS